MKAKSLVTWATAGMLALGGIALSGEASKSQPRPGERGFWCDGSSGIPTTVYQNSQGGREPWIEWVSNYFSGSGYDPMSRCEEVSARLENYRRRRMLNFITVGRMNGQNVICSASLANSRCEGLIYTLKPGQDAIQTLDNFLSWREGQAGVPSLQESGVVPYIDVRDRLEEDPGNVQEPTNTPQSTPQQQDQENMRDL